MADSLSTRLNLCSRPSKSTPDGAREVLQTLRNVGGRILLVSNGPEHDNPEGDIDGRGSIIIRPGLAHPLLQHDVNTPKSARITSCSFGYIHSSRRFDVSQPVDPNKPDQVEKVAEGQLSLARIIYCELRPVCGWIDEPGENEPSTKSMKDAELTYLFWANFFGPAYAERYGRDFLLAAPGWKKEELDDGGILYVVDESYMRWRTTEPTAALDYFRANAPSIRQYRSRGFERTEAILAGDVKPKRKRKKPPT